MPDQIAGFPFWQVTFDEAGKAAQQGETDALLADVPAAGVTDLFVFTHGWNNSPAAAHALYQNFFDQVRPVFDAPPTPHARAATIGVVGVIWPSKRWDDEPPPTPRAGGAASMAAPRSDGDLVRGLKAVFPAPDQQQALDALATLLDTRPEDPRALDQFQGLMKRLTPTHDPAAAQEDNGEAAMLTQNPEKVFAHFAALAPARPRRGGATGLGDIFGHLWDGAKEALRAATYWEMKKRAGVVGQEGLGPLVGRVAAATPGLRVHLLGHSFGARVASFALAGLPDAGSGAASPVKSLFLLQGAFSHFAFADALPFDTGRHGALVGMAARVDGPLLVSHSLSDTAVGSAYPLASILSHEDAAATDDLLFRWGAMGHDGAQAVNASAQPFGPVGQRYPLAASMFLNLDGNALITQGDPPSGAHGDIFHPEIAWASLAAAGIADGKESEP